MLVLEKEDLALYTKIQEKNLIRQYDLLTNCIEIGLKQGPISFGWPIWIGPTFMIVTMLIMPLAALGIAINSNAAPSALLHWLNLIGLVAGPANLALVVIAGLAPGKVADEPTSAVGTEPLASHESATEGGA